MEAHEVRKHNINSEYASQETSPTIVDIFPKVIFSTFKDEDDTWYTIRAEYIEETKTGYVYKLGRKPTMTGFASEAVEQFTMIKLSRRPGENDLKDIWDKAVKMKMDTRNTDIKISMPNTPVGLSELTNEAVNQVILESNVIQTMINNLDRNGITVGEVKKLDHTGCQPFLAVFVDGFVLHFSHVMYYGDHMIRVELKTTNDVIPNQLIFEMAFFCKFNYPLALKMEHKLGLNAGLTNGVQFIELLPEESKDTAIRICRILKDTIENSECNITEINM